MIPYEATRGYSVALDQLSVAALADLRALLASLDGESPDRQRKVLFEAFPEVFNPYAAATSAVSASFYEEVRALAGVKGATAQTLDAVETPRWNALVGWGSRGSVFERGGQALMYSLLSGGLTQVLSELASDTIIGNGENEDDEVYYQRVPQPGCCSFCGMLASRGAAYRSKEAAETVVGRGTPIPRNIEGYRRRRGGRAKGIRPRGSRRMGQEYHDHCKCRGVPVFADNYAEMQEDADKYYEAYQEAYTAVDERYELDYTQRKSADGSLKNTYFYTDSETGKRAEKDRNRLIVAKMRELTGAA